MKGNKFLAAMLAASMAFSAVPVTAMNVFANVTFTNTDGTATTTKSCTVNGVNAEDLDKSSEAYTIYNAINNVTFAKTDNTDTLKKTELQNALDALADHTIVTRTVTATSYNTELAALDGTVTVTSRGTNGVTTTYVLSFSTKETSDTGANETTALDALFDGITITKYSNESVTLADVQNAFDSALRTAKADASNSYFHAGEGSGYTYTVETATVSNGTVTGKLRRTGDDKVYYYTYTATVDLNKDSADDIIKGVISDAEKTEYPSFDKYVNDGVDTDDAVIAKIASDVSSLTDNKVSANVDKSSIVVVPATHTSAGRLSVKINNQPAMFTLAHSSVDKMKESDSAVTKTALKGSLAYGDSRKIKKANGDALDGATTGQTITYKVFNSTSSFSKALQAKNATKAVDAESVRAAVEKAVNDAVADYKDDNVTYKVESYDGEFDTNRSAQIAATTDDEGTYVVKVTATTPNDLFGFTGATTAATANLENDYYVVVKTPKLKAVATTGVSLQNKTVVLKKAYASTKGGTFDTAIVEITPDVTPDTANTTLTWSVNDANIQNNSATYYDKDGNPVDVNHNNGRFVVTKAGEYTIKVTTANGLTATMKLTVRDNFKDVPKTAYYQGAVIWAYGADVTAGTSDDTFGTNDPVTRAQYVTWLYKYAVSQDPTIAIADDDVKSVFSDVSTTAFYAKAVQWAKENGITAGTTATTFSPDRAITRAQAIQMLWVAKGRPYAGLGQEDEKTLKFNDVPDNAYYKTAVKWAVEKNVTAGTSATTFGPDDTCRRCQAIQFLYIGKGVNV